jgi:hypothetical protein
MRVEIRIGRLVLHGLPPVTARRLGTALARELEQLVADRGWPGTPGANARRRQLHAPGPAVPAGAGARVARGLAENIYRALGNLDRGPAVATPDGLQGRPPAAHDAASPDRA